MKAFALLAVFVLGCGGPPNVAGSCTSNDDCDEGLTCNTTVPGGYCTKSCTMGGSTSECPEESVCDAVSGNALTCVKVCQTSEDCRADLSCNGVTGSSIKACKPKE